MKKLLLIILFSLPIVVSAQGTLYERYASRTDVAVAQITGFRLDDSVRVDVVILAADNDVAWRKLTQEFKIQGEVGTTSWLGDPSQPAIRVKWSGRPVYKVIANHKRRVISLYLLNTDRQYYALLDYQMNNLTNKHK